jgi:hypothetical protein
VTPELLRGLLAELPLGRTLQVELTSGDFTLKLNLSPESTTPSVSVAEVPLTESEEELCKAFPALRKVLNG